jgi:hypothetical protein
MKLFKGGYHVVGRSSPNALYHHAMAEMPVREVARPLS